MQAGRQAGRDAGDGGMDGGRGEAVCPPGRHGQEPSGAACAVQPPGRGWERADGCRRRRRPPAPGAAPGSSPQAEAVAGGRCLPGREIARLRTGSSRRRRAPGWAGGRTDGAASRPAREQKSAFCADAALPRCPLRLEFAAARRARPVYASRVLFPLFSHWCVYMVPHPASVPGEVHFALRTPRRIKLRSYNSSLVEVLSGCTSLNTAKLSADSLSYPQG